MKRGGDDSQRPPSRAFATAVWFILFAIGAVAALTAASGLIVAGTRWSDHTTRPGGVGQSVAVAIPDDPGSAPAPQGA